MTNLLKSKKVQGRAAALFVAVSQGSEGVIFTCFGLILAVAGFFSSPAFSAATLLIRETILLAVLVLFYLPKLKSFILQIKERGVQIVVFSGFFTAFGNVSYLIAIGVAGSTYGVVLTSLYPVFSIIFFRFLFKEKQKYLVWLGVLVAFLSGMLFMFLPSFIGHNEKGIGVAQVLGMFAGMVAALFWSLEGVALKKGTDMMVKKVKASINKFDVLTYRTFGAWFMTLIIIFPISFAFGPSAHYLKEIIISWPAMLVVIAIAINLILLRYFHMFAINAIGPKDTAVIDANNYLVPAFFAIFLSMGHFHNVVDGTQLFEPFAWWTWLLLIPIFVGVFMVIYFSNYDKKVEDKCF